MYDCKERPHRVMKSRMVVEFKSHADGTLRKVKVRCVAKGYMQIQGIDYHNTYAPTVAGRSLKMMLALACEWGMELFGFDVEGAFLIPKLKPNAVAVSNAVTNGTT